MEMMMYPDRDIIEEKLRHFQDLLLSRAEFPGIQLRTNAKQAVFVGDLHGDCSMVKRLEQDFLKDDTVIVFLGDFIDRSPKDCKGGSIDTFLSIVDMKISHPENVFTLRGNHETFRHYPFQPHDFPVELLKRFGEDRSEELSQSFYECFDHLPLFLFTPNGVFSSHGGILKKAASKEDLFKIQSSDIDAVLDLTWGDPAVVKTFRGTISEKTNFTHAEFKGFLEAIGAKMMLRGHDYNTNGRSLFDDRLLTIFTSRRYKDRGDGGILVARLDLERAMETVHDLEVLAFKDDMWTTYKTGVYEP
jgi:hypothetical protein